MSFPSSPALVADEVSITPRTVIEALCRDQVRARDALNLTPSENILSPLARVPFILDAYSRYFFDHLRKFGAWSFYGGIELGRIEQEILLPLCREMAHATYVNAQPISGLNCMTVAIAALTSPGDTMLTVPVDCGGHISTAGVAGRLGVRTVPLPMTGHYDINLTKLAEVLRNSRPSVIYIDQSTQLFPIDPYPIREIVDAYSPGTLIHFDSSHINGLILGGAVFNPLNRGAHSFGGSTHKTLPGPHKGFLATNDAQLADRIDQAAGILISHHHPAEVLSLTITLLEMVQCGGAAYASAILANAQRLAHRLHDHGVAVAAPERGFTGCHQVWVDPGAEDGAVSISSRLFDAGLVINRLDSLPGIPRPALRLSVAEITRLGAAEHDVDDIADALSAVIVSDASSESIRHNIAAVRSRLDSPKYCADIASLETAALLPEMIDLLGALGRLITRPKSTDTSSGRS